MTGWRLWGALALAGLALAGLGYAFGRYEAPDRVQESKKEEVHTEAKEDLTSKAEIQRLTAELETLKRDTHRETVVVRHVDGTIEKHETVDTHVAQTAQVQAAEVQTVTVHDVQTVTQDRIVTVTKTVERERPNFRVGPLLGFDGRTLGMAVGAAGERRILGPISAGVWLSAPARSLQSLRSYQAGASLTVEF